LILICQMIRMLLIIGYQPEKVISKAAVPLGGRVVHDVETHGAVEMIERETYDINMKNGTFLNT
jgi:hypothetical protein